MTIVNFYVTPHQSAMQALHFACDLVEKAYQQNRQVYLQMDSKEDAERLDRLLWTYSEQSFLPHQIGQGDDPILLGYGEPPTRTFQVLVNLSSQVPPFYNQCEEVIEIVFNDPIVQQLARERYKYYRDQGLPITTHK